MFIQLKEYRSFDEKGRLNFYIYIYIYIVIYMNGTYYIQLVQNQLHYKDGGNEEIDVKWARFHVLFFLRGPNVVI